MASTVLKETSILQGLEYTDINTGVTRVGLLERGEESDQDGALLEGPSWVKQQQQMYSIKENLSLLHDTRINSLVAIISSLI